MRRLAIFIAFVSFASSGCSTSLQLDNRSCPCSTGWSCCDGANICVRGDQSCPPPPALVITPASAALPLGGSTPFSASSPVSWSLVEGAVAGTVDANGNYRASSAHGLFHLRATDVSDAQRTATVELDIGPSRMDIWAGTPGGAGTADGTGASARFNEPLCLTGDGLGNLYICDSNGDFTGRIRKVVIATGEVTTVAKGLLGPTQLAFQPPSSLYVVNEDYVDNLRSLNRLDLSTGLITPVISPFAYGPIAADGSGHLIVGTPFALSSVDLATGTMTVVAGGTRPDPATPQSGYDGTGAAALVGTVWSIAYAGNGQFIFLDQHEDETGSAEGRMYQRVFDSRAQTVTTNFAYSQPAALGWSWSICASGVASLGTSILKADGTATLDYFVNGSSLNPIYCDPGSTFVYAIDAPNLELRALDTTYSTAFTLAGAAQHDDVPGGSLAADGAGNLFVAGSAGLSRIEASSGVASVVLNGLYSSDAGVAIDPSGHLLITLETTLFEWSQPPTDGVNEVPTPITWLSQSYDLFGIAAGDNGVIYATADNSSSTAILALDLKAQTATTLTTAPVDPVAVGWLPGALIIVEPTKVERLDLATLELTLVAGPENGWLGLSSIAVDAPNQIAYVADGGTGLGHTTDHMVRAIDLVSGLVSPLAGSSDHGGVLLGALPGGLNQPAGVAILPSGDLAISDAAENLVVRVHR